MPNEFPPIVNILDLSLGTRFVGEDKSTLPWITGQTEPWANRIPLFLSTHRASQSSSTNQRYFTGEESDGNCCADNTDSYETTDKPMIQL